MENKLLKEGIVKSQIDKLIIETSTQDVGVFPKMMKPLLHRMYTESLVSEIADVQPLTSPSAKIFSLFSNYVGNNKKWLNDNNSVIIQFEDAITDNVNDIILTTTGEGVIEYIEKKAMLVSISTGHFEKGQDINGNEILSVMSNRNYIRKMFPNYTGSWDTITGENITIPELKHQIKSNTLEVKTRKVKSKISLEAAQDIKAQFGEDVADGIIEREFGNEIRYAIDSEIIDYLKRIATPEDDVILANGYGTQSGFAEISNDLFLNVFKLTIDIMRDTKRRKNFFILADSATMAILMSNPLHAKPEGDNPNSYYMGKLGGNYSLYLDPYSEDNYVLVGYKGGDTFGDAGLIYAPYINQTFPVLDPETGEQVYINHNRYAYTTNPQDVTTGNSDSIFFKMFNVDLSNLYNYWNNK